MAAWMKGALALVALGAVVGVALWLGGAETVGRDAPVVTGREATEAGAMEVPAGSLRDAPARSAGEVEPLDVAAAAPRTPSDGEAAAVAPRPRATLTGRVQDVGGRAVAGARVVFHAQSGPRLLRVGGDEDEPGEPRPETRTDAQGRFEFVVDVPESGDEEDVDVPLAFRARSRLATAHEAYATLLTDVPDLREGVRDLGVLVVEPGSRLVGRVVDEAGRAIAGARVKGHPLGQDGRNGRGFARFLANQLAEQYSAAETGPDGRFQITGLPAGRAELVAEADGRQVGGRDGLEVEAGVTQDVGDITLPAGALIAGFVTDGDGAPVEGATVTVSSMARLVVRRMEDMPRRQIGREMRLRAETDADGWFELLGLGEGQYTVHVSADGFARSSTENVPTGTRDLSVRLAPLGELVLTLRGASDRRPVTGAAVHATPRADGPFRGFGEPLEVVESETTPGEYTVLGAGQGGTQLIVAAEGYAALELDGPSVPEGGAEELLVELVPESVIAGRVVDADGSGIADARVRLTEYVPPSPHADGRFEVRREVRRRLGGGEDTDPLQQATRAVTADDGSFVLRGVPAGDWELVARAEDFVTSSPQVLSLEAGGREEGLVVELAVGGAVVGRVTDDAGLPVASANVLVQPAGPAPRDDDPHRRMAAMFGGPEDGPRRATTREDGTFEVRSLPPGPYDVELGTQRGMDLGGAMVFVGEDVRGSGDDDQVVRVTVVAGQEAWVDLVQPPTSTLEGRVLAGGEPVEATTVSLRPAGSFLPFGGRTAETDRYGRFLFERVEPGDYELSAVVPGAALPETRDVTLEGGRDEEADLVFSGSTLRGRVVDTSTERGAPGVTIVVTPVRETGERREESIGFSVVMVNTSGGGGGGMSMEFGGGSQSKVRTDANGDFEVRFLDPGEYSLETLGGAYVGDSVGPVQVEAGTTVDDVLIEVVRGATLTGRVVSGETGMPLQGAPVSLSAPGSREMTMTEDGRFTFEGLDAGDYTVEVMGSGFGSEPVASQAVSLEVGEYRELDLSTDP